MPHEWYVGQRVAILSGGSSRWAGHVEESAEIVRITKTFVATSDGKKWTIKGENRGAYRGGFSSLKSITPWTDQHDEIMRERADRREIDLLRGEAVRAIRTATKEQLRAIIDMFGAKGGEDE